MGRATTDAGTQKAAAATEGVRAEMIAARTSTTGMAAASTTALATTIAIAKVAASTTALATTIAIASTAASTTALATTIAIASTADIGATSGSLVASTRGWGGPIDRARRSSWWARSSGGRVGAALAAILVAAILVDVKVEIARGGGFETVG